MFPVFEPHEWINASETLEDVIALKVPSDRVAVQLHLRAVTKTPAYLGGLNVEWNSKRIVELPDVLDSDPPPATLS